MLLDYVGFGVAGLRRIWDLVLLDYVGFGVAGLRRIWCCWIT